MTTEMQGGPSRRSFLAALTAAGVVAGGGLGLMVAAAPMASAATGADVEWRITGEPEEDRLGYARMLLDVTTAIADHRIRLWDQGNAGASMGYPVDVTQSTGTSSYITVDLHGEGDRPEFIRLILRRSDAYLMGWFQGTEDGAGVVRLGDFFPLEAGLPDQRSGRDTTRPASRDSRPDRPGQHYESPVQHARRIRRSEGTRRHPRRHADQCRQPQRRRAEAPGR
ncbi:hypothetical protein [Streptomyces sp. DSM 15324]|uniref:hypothetical protein n=1 Tax=Streptomyces sp. DSM 15324 TaxID=1739111 RepID=UPI000747194F|nr:hypothetical protein [Streptomyces sp. DSM 15324]KUO07300.1 hypothetical protein AQJ58_36845 [Streptomyces sp. DSM 15324]